jgi:uncharacterized protein YkwD
MRVRFICLLCISLLFHAGTLCAQNAQKPTNQAQPDFMLIARLYSAKLDALRKEKNCTTLPADATLQKAAKDQAAYMLQIHTITHSQKTKEKADPRQRVLFYGGTNDQVGENCIMIYLYKPMHVKYSKTVLTVHTSEEAAEALFLGWKNSPGHFKNMVTPEYDVQGIDFAWNADSSALYATQVFSAKPFVPLKGAESPADAFKILPAAPTACACFETEDGKKIKGRFEVSIQNGLATFRSEDLPLLKRFFSNPKDAIYFDLVLREQFTCEKNNLLHGSPLFDGTMLPPILISEILKQNQAKDGKNLFTQIPIAVPDCFKGKQINDNYGIIKNGYGCTYLWHHYIPSEPLEILTLYPKWLYEKGVVIQPDTFKGQLTFSLPFERGKTVLSARYQEEIKNKIRIYDPYIRNVEIRTYSSVEGNTDLNIRLQEKRAEEIGKLLKTICSQKPAVSIQSKENWEDFNRQVEKTRFGFLAKLPHDSVKARLRNRTFLDSVDYLLQSTRLAHIVIDIEAVVDNNSSAYLILASYKKAIRTGDSLRAFRCQQKLLESAFNYSFNKTDIALIDVPYARKFLPVWTNYLAMAVQDTEMAYSGSSREAALHAQRIDTAFKPIQFNFCMMALKYLHLYSDTLIPVSRLEQKMLSCFGMSTDKLDSVLVNHMLLNYSILSTDRHWRRHEYDKLDKHLSNVHTYYPKAQITEYEALKLGLLFNHYARTSWTIEMLLPYMRTNTKNEDVVFLFVQTYDNFHGTLSAADWEVYLHKAHKMNPGRFHDWINVKSFQYLRMPAVKKEYCSFPN